MSKAFTLYYFNRFLIILLYSTLTREQELAAKYEANNEKLKEKLDVIVADVHKYENMNDTLKRSIIMKKKKKLIKMYGLNLTRSKKRSKKSFLRATTCFNNRANFMTLKGSVSLKTLTQNNNNDY